MELQKSRRARIAAQDADLDFQFLIEHIKPLVCKVDAEGKYLYASPSYMAILGYDPVSLIGRSSAEFLHPDDMAAAADKFDRIQAPGTTTVDLWRFRHASGRWLWLECSATVSQAGDGSLQTIVVSNDITQHKGIEDAQAFLAQRAWAKAGEDFFASLARYLAENLALDYVYIDRLGEGSPTATTISIWHEGKFEENITFGLAGTPCGEVAEKSLCCYPRDVCALFPEAKALHDMGAEAYAGTTLHGSDGKTIGLIALVSRRPFEDGAYMLSILRLVSGRAAGELERRDGMEALERSIARTETLMRELQHRVKNNLNIISSLLSLESRSLRDEASKELFLDAQSRIRSMSAIYERLCLSSDYAHVRMDDYFRDLATGIFSTFYVDSGLVRLELSLSSLDLDTRKAVPLGLIMNELLTNAIKHAFPGGASGSLSVVLAHQDGKASLEVSDDGVGLPEGLVPDGTRGLGFTLIRSLASQIEAEVSVAGAPGEGLRVRIDFAT